VIEETGYDLDTRGSNSVRARAVSFTLKCFRSGLRFLSGGFCRQFNLG